MAVTAIDILCECLDAGKAMHAMEFQRTICAPLKAVETWKSAPE